ncbi:hypothetical protein IPA_02240 [Ignicoccus pacificus DSM 13166]|uniref:WD40 repeat domain-containing protein n=1 Tax=Ignicoccus pacificus DSM 13166 TaxID=940294 RepID=A0A977KAN3_9CREN|nr:hypothetical protein IPA_02240 [Ignicoccus pacificus DSM 13166]
MKYIGYDNITRFSILKSEMNGGVRTYVFMEVRSGTLSLSVPQLPFGKLKLSKIEHDLDIILDDKANDPLGKLRGVLWLNNKVQAIAVTKGLYGISSTCSHVFDSSLGLIEKKCSFIKALDVSSYNSRIVFTVLSDNNSLYLFDSNLNRWFRISAAHPPRGVTLFRRGILVGYRNLEYIALDEIGGSIRGLTKYSIFMKKIEKGPAICENLVYVARHEWPSDNEGTLSLVDIDTYKLKEVKSFTFSEALWDVKVCKDIIALGGARHVYLLELSKSYELKEIIDPIELIGTSFPRDYGAYSISFSPDCKYLASTNYEGMELLIINLDTSEVFKYELSDNVVAVSWESELVVGLRGGMVYIFSS